MVFIQNKDFEFIEVSDKEITDLIKDKFVVALDFDGVITAPYFLKSFYLKKLGYNVAEDKCSPLNCLKLGVSKEDHNSATRMAFTSSPENLPLEKDFLKYFKKIKKLGNVAIFVLTSRDEELLEHLRNYLAYHKIKLDGILNTSHKSKTESLKLLRSGIFIEDSPFKLRQVVDELGECLDSYILILYRNVQNLKEKKPSPKIIEINNWKEIFSVVKTSLLKNSLISCL